MRMWLVFAIACVAGCKQKAHEPSALAETARECSRAELGCPRPILYVHDLMAARRYYHEQLGFKLDWIDDPPDFASVSRGDTQLFMCQRCQGHPGSWLWVATPDVDRLHAELVERGAIIKSPPGDKRWGVREMEVADPDGNVLRIGSPIKDR